MSWQHRIVPPEEHTPPKLWFRGEIYASNVRRTCTVCRGPIEPGLCIRRGGDFSHYGCGAKEQKRGHR